MNAARSYRLGLHCWPQNWGAQDAAYNAILKTWATSGPGKLSVARNDVTMSLLTSASTSSIISNPIISTLTSLWAGTGIETIAQIGYGPYRNAVWAGAAGFTGNQADIDGNNANWQTWSAANWPSSWLLSGGPTSWQWPSSINSLYASAVQLGINTIYGAWIAAGGDPSLLLFELWNEPVSFGFYNGGTGDAPILASFHTMMGNVWANLDFKGCRVLTPTMLFNDPYNLDAAQISNWASACSPWIGSCTDMAVHLYPGARTSEKWGKCDYASAYAARAAAIYDALQTHPAFAAKPVHITETGLTAANLAPWKPVSYFECGEMIAAAIERAMHLRPFYSLVLYASLDTYADTSSSYGLARISDRKWSSLAYGLARGGSTSLGPDGTSWLTGSGESGGVINMP